MTAARFVCLVRAATWFYGDNVQTSVQIWTSHSPRTSVLDSANNWCTLVVLEFLSPAEQRPKCRRRRRTTVKGLQAAGSPSHACGGVVDGRRRAVSWRGVARRRASAHQLRDDRDDGARPLHRTCIATTQYYFTRLIYSLQAGSAMR